MSIVSRNVSNRRLFTMPQYKLFQGKIQMTGRRRRSFWHAPKVGNPFSQPRRGCLSPAGAGDLSRLGIRIQSLGFRVQAVPNRLKAEARGFKSPRPGPLPALAGRGSFSPLVRAPSGDLIFSVAATFKRQAQWEDCGSGFIENGECVTPSGTGHFQSAAVPGGFQPDASSGGADDVAGNLP